MHNQTIPTTPFTDQRCGTAGLRKKTAVFRQPHYLENFVQAVFDCVPELAGGTLVLGGDGRYFNTEAIQVILRMAAAHGIRRALVGRGGLLSTPAASHLIRARQAQGGFILTASHNPGGPDGDFGIKFNLANGGQASETLTEAIYQRSRVLSHYRILASGSIALDQPGRQSLGELQVEVVDPVADYTALQESLFDFERIAALLARPDFKFRYDALHAVTGPYAEEIFIKRLGAPAGSLQHAKPLPDFGGGHPDPNPHDAHELVQQFAGATAPDFGAASDGDGDRNMILAPGLVVSPGDSLAVLAANAELAPGYRQGLAGVARSMPTSRAVDAVAEALGIACYETPTGWRYFSNLLDADRITLCGEESFGTSSNHCREKDGLWAVLFWLNLLAATELSVNELLRRHWAQYGRHYYQRQDYQIADAERARELMQSLTDHLPTPGTQHQAWQLSAADNFSYTDPVDNSHSSGQGIRLIFGAEARIVYRLSGTGTSGATLRVYLERYAPAGGGHDRPLPEALGELAVLSRAVGRIEHFTELAEPSHMT